MDTVYKFVVERGGGEREREGTTQHHVCDRNLFKLPVLLLLQLGTKNTHLHALNLLLISLVKTLQMTLSMEVLPDCRR